MKLLFTNLFLIFILFINSSYSQYNNIYIDQVIQVNKDFHVTGYGYFGLGEIKISVGDKENETDAFILRSNSAFFEAFIPSKFTGLGYQNVRIYNKSDNALLYYGENMIFYPTINSEYPPISINDVLISNSSNNGFVSASGFFGLQLSEINITIGPNYDQNKIYISYIDSYYFEGYVLPAREGYHDIKIFNSKTDQLMYYAPKKIYYQRLPVNISQVIQVDQDYHVYGYGYFDFDPIKIIIGNNQSNAFILRSNYSFFEAFVPSGLFGYQDVRIYNASNYELLYYGENMIYYPERTPITIDEISNITSTTGIVFIWGYFGLDVNQINITIGDYWVEKSINITYFNMNFVQGIAPLFSNGYYDARIYNKTTNELLYYGQNKILYQIYNESSSSIEPSSSVGGSSIEASSYEASSSSSYEASSSSYETSSSSSSAIEPTPTPSQSPIIKCEYSSNGFIINSTESIECKGVGPTYCETNSGSTCSTDSSNSTIKCATKSKSPFTSSLNCIGNNIECKSLYVTCSINKPQSSYLLVNNIEQKSNYYDHSQKINNNQEDSNKNSNSASSSTIYSSLSLLVLLISTILIIN